MGTADLPNLAKFHRSLSGAGNCIGGDWGVLGGTATHFFPAVLLTVATFAVLAVFGRAA